MRILKEMGQVLNPFYWIKLISDKLDLYDGEKLLVEDMTVFSNKFIPFFP